VGRFTQPDPIGLAGGLNLYGFAGGDPVNFSDPFGLCPNCKNHNESMLTGLSPETRTAAEKFLKAAEAEGVDVWIHSGFRSSAAQDSLYARGRTNPGNIVTNAKGGQSAHNHGRAIDVVEADKTGKLLWSTSDWQRIGRMGKEAGFQWGGDWKTFKDRPHLETKPLETKPRE
jgi:peptidoglycan L-alanyl-D-glutamate endopeptidase CwlK